MARPAPLLMPCPSLPGVAVFSDRSARSAEQAEQNFERTLRLVRLTAYGEEEYPPLLREIECAASSILEGRSLASVAPCRGHRAQRVRARPQVRAATGGGAWQQRLSRRVVGLARGIDTAAHEASLKSGTAAVVLVASTLSTRPKTKSCIAALGNGACSSPNACRARSRRPSTFRAATG